MDKALKTKWLEALRSGKYKQGPGHLRNGDKFCCLGVLCDVSGQGEWRQGDYPSNYCYYKEGESDFYRLPSFMEEFSGIGAGTEEDLVELNDIDELSFPGIANWIEKNVSED